MVATVSVTSASTTSIITRPDTQNFNLCFPFTPYEGVVNWRGGHFGIDNDNSDYLFSAGGLDFVVVHLEFDTDANAVVLD